MFSHSSSALRLSLVAVLALLVALVAGAGAPARAANIAVNTTDDELNSDGDCSLREAITAANTDAGVDACTAGSGPDTVTLPAGTYTLSIGGAGEDVNATGDLDITADLTITGAGEGSTIIDGGAIDRVFDVDPAGTGITMDFSGMTIRNGSAAVAGTDGGGIRTLADALTLTDVTLTSNTADDDGGGFWNGNGGPTVALTLTDVTISGNTASNGSGGGFWNGGGLLTMAFTNVTFSGNTASNGSGGGFWNGGGSVTMTFTNVTISGNTAATDGGGFWNGGGLGTMTFTNSTVSGNTATTGDGGGFWNGGGLGTLTVTGSTVSGNNATSGSGGGIENVSGTATVTNSTISGNSAASGGGVDNRATLTLTNVTIASNTASSGGGIWAFDATVVNTIIADNGTGLDCFVTVALTSSYSLDSDGSCNLTGTGDLPSTDPQLGPLADNGGPTQTHALLAGSPAIDVGDNVACPATDQRGVARPVDGDEDGTATCDIGAYEYQPPATPTPTPASTPAPTPAPTPAELPPSGGQPADGSSFLWLLLVVGGIVVLSGGLVLARQVRRVR